MEGELSRRKWWLCKHKFGVVVGDKQYFEGRVWVV